VAAGAESLGDCARRLTARVHPLRQCDLRLVQDALAETDNYCWHGYALRQYQTCVS
jgi:hypothetical protein